MREARTGQAVQRTPEGDSQPVAELVADVWEKLLGTSAGPDDNFFEIGGNSLLAARLKTALHEVGLPTVTLRDLYLNSSLSAMAELLRSRRSTARKTTS